MNQPEPSRVVRFSLDEAKDAVLHTLRRLATEEHLLSEAEGVDLAARVNAFTDTFALDDELVLGVPLLKERFCGFPSCFSPPRAPKTGEGGAKVGGKPPRYCDGVDERGRPHADAQWAKRCRERLREEARASARGGQPDDATDDEQARPVTQARASLAVIVTEIERGVGELLARFESLQQLAERSTDERLVTSEIQTIRREAREEVEREAGLRASAENRGYQMELFANRMKADVEETQEAIAQVEEQAARDRAERDAATARAEEVTQAAEREIAEVRRQADEAIANAQATLDEELTRRAEEMRVRVETADKARDVAVADAARREREADARVASAQQRAASAETASAEAKAEAARVAEANAGLRDAAVEREREFESVVAGVHSTYREELATLRATIEKLHEQADSARANHDVAMERLRDKHADDLAARLAEAAAAAARLHDAETARLNAQIELLQTRLHATGATRDDTAGHDTAGHDTDGGA